MGCDNYFRSTNNKGFIILGAGLLAAYSSTLLGQFAVLGTASDFIRGFLDGLSVGAFGAAIFIIVRGLCANQE